MATPAIDESSMTSALWEAATAGNTAEASRLLDAGAPVDWKNAAVVSSETVGAPPARCGEHGDRCNHPDVVVPPFGLLQHGSRGK